MADLLRHGHITDARVYEEGNDLVGIADEFSAPEIEWNRVDHETLGQVAIFKPPARPLQALEGSLVLKFPEPDVYERMLNPTRVHNWQLHSKADIWGPDGLDAEKSFVLVTTVGLMFYKPRLTGAKLGDEQKVEADFSCVRMRQTIHASGRELFAVDVFANSVDVGGSPVWG